jgi:predicted DNA-binding transcriptional regulator YafY
MMDLLRDRPGLSISQIAEALGRSERTIYRYLESLSGELHVPVYCEHSGYYVADRPVASQLDLSPKEVLAVRLALTSGSLNKSGPFADHALSAWKKVEAALTGDTVESVRSAVKRHSIHTPAHCGENADSEIVSCIAAAIERNKTLSVVYCSQRSGETKTLIIDPYALVFRRHNWYLIAHSQNHNRTVQLKMVRIVKAVNTGESFELPHGFSIDSFYAKSWEMWAGGEERKVRVKFSPRVAGIIRESKRHPSQELEDTPDGSVIFSVKVSGTEEIGFWILSWGAEAEVLEPQDLRASIEDTTRAMLAIYPKAATASMVTVNLEDEL